MSQQNSSITDSTTASTFARELKVRTLQNKLTVFVVALLLFVMWPFLNSSWDNYIAARDARTAQQELYVQKTAEQKQVLADLKILKDVSGDGQKQALMQCYNTNCTNLPASLQKEPVKTAFKTYLQLQQSTPETKFALDQKKLLTYVNEFLVKASDGAQNNGEITALTL
jgi:hypothetical protein